ncbi:MAG: T9SS type A sorting domain-containing protein [Lewinella sp.]|uniref:T9SS type A sorting domain-containing protein n=1 Tax=Lewinella sp. TaxID=2004506 RepID=UPI003D6BC6CE
MKVTLSLGVICLLMTTTLHSQITFEEVTPPNDFSLAVVRKSPTGEYLTQAMNDRSTVYTSLDGVTWTQEVLPESQALVDVQFYADGTPVLKSENYDHCIRRDGSWYTLDLDGGWGGVQASFIKGDTLFVYENSSFGYSVNKGLTFVPIFTYGEGFVDHRTHLWVFDHYLALHHTAGASDDLSVFSRDGTRIRNESLNLGSGKFAYNDCGKVLLFDHSNYYSLSGEGLVFESGSVSSIASDFAYGDEILSSEGDWYYRNGASLLKSTGCNFDWEEVLNDPILSLYGDLWLSDQSDYLLSSTYFDFFIERSASNSEWEEYPVLINYSYTVGIDESYQNQQVVNTPNDVFVKTVGEENWEEVVADENAWHGGQYSPNGSLYLNRGDAILYSQDNGQNFSIIEGPDNEPDGVINRISVLDDGVIYIDGSFSNYYTLNNGQDWISTNFLLNSSEAHVKLVGSEIFVVNAYFEFSVVKINTITGEHTGESLGTFPGLYAPRFAIMDDGTIYLVVDEFIDNETRLYRFRFGEPLVNLGNFFEASSGVSMSSSGLDLFLFSSSKYYIFDGANFVEYSYSGLPQSFVGSFFVTDNQYVYAIYDKHRIFRSTAPLSSPQFITGTLFHNDSEDCEPEPLDNTLAYWQVKLEGDAYSRIKSTDSEGNFNFSVPLGTYSLSAEPINANWELCEPSFTVVMDEDDATLVQDFQAKALEECASLEIDFSTPLLRRCFDNYYTVQVRNTGPLTSTATTLTLTLDPFFDFISATIPYNQINDTEITFDLGALEVNEVIMFNLEFNLSCEAELGQEHCLFGVISDDNSCLNSRTEHFECQNNIGSFDPNDKRIFNESGVETDRVDLEEYIYYHIRFQNTGTDTAFTVRIVDPISPILDVSTLTMLSASHPYEYEINDGASLVVHFTDILLPDSTTNEPASHGFFRFKIKPLPEYGYGTEIPNQAGIYFDFNEPVITNEAVLVIQEPVRVKNPINLTRFQVFPNPTEDVLSILIEEEYHNRISNFEILNTLGEVVVTGDWLTSNKLQIAHLPAGIYQILLREGSVIIGVEKFVKH